MAQGQRTEIPSQDFLMPDKSSLCSDLILCHPNCLDSEEGSWCQSETSAALLQLPGNSGLCCHIEGDRLRPHRNSRSGELQERDKTASFNVRLQSLLKRPSCSKSDLKTNYSASRAVVWLPWPDSCFLQELHPDLSG